MRENLVLAVNFDVSFVYFFPYEFCFTVETFYRTLLNSPSYVSLSDPIYPLLTISASGSTSYGLLWPKIFMKFLPKPVLNNQKNTL